MSNESSKSVFGVLTIVGLLSTVCSWGMLNGGTLFSVQNNELLWYILLGVSMTVLLISASLLREEPDSNSDNSTNVFWAYLVLGIPITLFGPIIVQFATLPILIAIDLMKGGGMTGGLCFFTVLVLYFIGAMKGGSMVLIIWKK